MAIDGHPMSILPAITLRRLLVLSSILSNRDSLFCNKDFFVLHFYLTMWLNLLLNRFTTNVNYYSYNKTCLYV